jgi:hypothetical protein
MNIIKIILTKLHSHDYNKPIVSRYVSFSERDIVFECNCGKRQLLRERREFSDAFSMLTTMGITKTDVKKLLR